jgi:hypothetical protein
MGYPTELAGSIKNYKKIIGTPNHPLRTKKGPKKSMFSTLKKKEPKDFTQNIENIQHKRKISNCISIKKCSMVVSCAC